MKSTVHIIYNDKFTGGYINYMETLITNRNHHFIILGENRYEIDLMNDGVNVFYIKNDKEIKGLYKAYSDLLKKASEIIISGLFWFPEKYIFNWPQSVFKKVYMQFWGGDFYKYRGKIKAFSGKFFHKYLLHFCILRCGGIINLIDEDYEEFSKIFPNKKQHYVANMPNDPRVEIDYTPEFAENNNILVGNSAYPSNYHLEVFKKLEHLKNEDIKIICPLSYGSKNYAEKIVEIGNKTFGDKFVPLLDYMDLDDYHKVLKNCKVGIFYNDRQQAMGNISYFFEHGKKLYLRTGTSMWRKYNDVSLKVFDADSIDSLSAKELFSFDMNEMLQNIEHFKDYSEKNNMSWVKFFNSVE